MKHISEEHKKKIRDALIGNTHRKGKHLSEEHKRMISRVHKGKYVSVDTKKKMSEAQIGKHHSEESKRKISAFFKGKPLTEETRKKMSESHKGKHHWKEENKLKGEINPNWNGGASFLPYPPEFNVGLKQFIRDRDGNECRSPYCNHENGVLNIHHIDYNKKNCNQCNLITLCSPCNARANGNRKEWKRLYKRIIWGKGVNGKDKLTTNKLLRKGEILCLTP